MSVSSHVILISLLPSDAWFNPKGELKRLLKFLTHLTLFKLSCATLGRFQRLMILFATCVTGAKVAATTWAAASVVVLAVHGFHLLLL
jgi:hypothetical protein